MKCEKVLDSPAKMSRGLVSWLKLGVTRQGMTKDGDIQLNPVVQHYCPIGEFWRRAQSMPRSIGLRTNGGFPPDGGHALKRK